MDKKEEIKQKFNTLFIDNLSRVGESSSAYINSFRAEAMKQFMELGIPDKKNEAYKYTNLEPWFRANYKSFFIPDKSDFSVASDFRCEVDELNVHELVLVNGFYPTTNGSMKELDASHN